MKRLNSVKTFFTRRNEQWPDLPWIETESISASGDASFDIPITRPDATAFIQYTSGSTGDPKGVEVTYGNLQHQFEMNQKVLGICENSVLVTWTPHFHDFCLISGILQCLGGKSKMYIMSPIDFVKNPAVWFEVLNRVRGTHIAAPNFAYEMLSNKVTDEQAASWDLSCIEIAMSAAEPIKSSTMEKFFAKFAASKFPRKCFCPSYGLAEHTVGVTLFGDDMIRVNRQVLESRGVCEVDESSDYRLWSCGRAMPGVDIKIIDTESLEPKGSLQVGEVWVNSPSKTPGYLNKPTLNRDLVHATFKGQEEGTEGYLRTGDLGFLRGDELFITGRLKDLIIVRGRNIAPHDIEATACAASEQLLRPGKSIAFGVNQDNGDELVYIIAEQRSKEVLSESEYDSLAQLVRKSVANHHQVTPVYVGFLLPGNLPLSSSGKPQRRLCMSLFTKSDPKLRIVGSKSFSLEVREEQQLEKKRSEEQQQKHQQQQQQQQQHQHQHQHHHQHHQPQLHQHQISKPARLAVETTPSPADVVPLTFEQIEEKVKQGFAGLARSKRGRATHTHGVMGRGVMMMLSLKDVFPKSISQLLGDRTNVVLRHANIKGFADDAIIDGRGASLRIQLSNGKHQDIIMSTGKRFFRRSAASFFEWFSAKLPQRAEICKRDGEIEEIVSEIFCDPACYTDVEYYTEVPVRVAPAGDGKQKARSLAQFRLRTKHATNQHVERSELQLPLDYIPRREGDERAKDYLRQAFREKLSSQGRIEYELAIQLRDENEEDIDVYDCTKEWDEAEHPFHPIGIITISDTFDSEGEEEEANEDGEPYYCFNVQCEGGFLSVPTTTDANHPSSLNQLRSVVYSFASEARREAGRRKKSVDVTPMPSLTPTPTSTSTSKSRSTPTPSSIPGPITTRQNEKKERSSRQQRPQQQSQSVSLPELVPSAGDTSPEAVTELFRDVGAKLGSVHTDMDHESFKRSIVAVLEVPLQQHGMQASRAVGAVAGHYDLEKVVSEMVSEITVEQSVVPTELKAVMGKSASNNLGWYNGTERAEQEACMKRFTEVIPEPAWRTSSAIDRYGMILWSREDTRQYFRSLSFLDKVGIQTRMAASPYYLVRVSSGFAVILLRANTTATGVGENQINDTVSPITEYLFLLTKTTCQQQNDVGGEDKEEEEWGLVGVYNSVGESAPNETEERVNDFVRRWVGFADARSEEEEGRFANALKNKMLAAFVLKELFAGIGSVVDHSKPKPRSLELASRFRERRTRSMQLAADTKFVIVGAGPSGLTCAQELLRNGYTNVQVIEKEDRVAGKAGTFYHHNREGQVGDHDDDDHGGKLLPYDLGAHVITTQHSEEHPRLQAMFQAYGIELAAVTPYYIYDTKQKRKLDMVPPQTDFEELSAMAGFGSVAHSREQVRAHRFVGGAASWLSKRGLRDNAWNIPFVSSGYGFVTDEVPAARVVKMAEMLNQTGRGTLAQTPKKGFAELWERVAARLGPQNLRLSTAVTEIRRSEEKDGGEEGTCEVFLEDGTTVSADRVIVCCPPSQVPRLIADQTRNERDIFSRVRTLKYFTTICRITGIPRLGFYLYKQECETGAELDHVVSFHHRHEESDVYCLYSYGKPESGPEQILSTLHSDIERIGGRVEETLLAPVEWQYGAYFSADDLEMGMLDRYEGIQGLGNTYYSSCLGNFELIDCCVEYSTDLVERFFCKEKETPLWSLRADVLPGKATGVSRVSRASLEHSVRMQISDATGTPVDEVSLRSPLEVFGLDSITLFQLLGNMSRMLKMEVPPQVVAEYPSFDSFLNSVYSADVDNVVDDDDDEIKTIDVGGGGGEVLSPSDEINSSADNERDQTDELDITNEDEQHGTAVQSKQPQPQPQPQLRVAAVTELIPERKQLQYPLSFEQERFWAASMLCGEDTSPMNVSLVYEVKGSLDVEMLRRSAWALYRKHECLRTAVLVNKNGTPYQKVVDFDKVRDKILVTDGEEFVARSDKEARLREAQGRAFDLREAPLWELTLLRVAAETDADQAGEGEEETILNVTYHHIAGDGMAGGLFVRELVELYNEFTDNNVNADGSNEKNDDGLLRLLRRREGACFGDFCSWQREAYDYDESMTRHTSYWEEYLSGAVPLQLPEDNGGNENDNEDAAVMGRYLPANSSLFFDFPADLTESVRSCAKLNTVTPYVVLLSAFKLTLSHWTGSRDILVSSPNSGRTNRQLEGVVGMTAFPMFLRTRLEAECTASDLLLAVDRTVADARDNQCNGLGQQTLPVSDIAGIFQSSSGQAEYLLNQVMFNYVGESSTNTNTNDNGTDNNDNDSNTKNRRIEVTQDWGAGKPSGGMQFFWTSGIVDGVIRNTLLFDPQLFSEKTMNTVIDNYTRLLTMLTSAGSSSTVVSAPAVGVTVAASFTVDPMLSSLEYWALQLGQQSALTFSIAPYNQVCQQLLDPSSLLNENEDNNSGNKEKKKKTKKKVNVVMLRVEDLVRHSPNPSPADLADAVGVLLAAFENRSNSGVETLVYLCPSDVSGCSDALREAIEVQNGRIVDELGPDPRVHVFVEETLAEEEEGEEGTETFDRSSDEVGHIPYTDLYFTWLGTKVARALQSIVREPYKVIVLDCDNTLWKGVCAEGTMEVSEPYRAFQRKMRSCQRKGMLLCLCSKNEDGDVAKAFEDPRMVLSMENIVLQRVNWKRKSENVKEMAADLNLGLDSFIFIDDNPVECEEMRSNCPSVTTLQFPPPCGPSSSSSSVASTDSSTRRREEEIMSFTNDTWLFDTPPNNNNSNSNSNSNKGSSLSVDTSRTELYRSESLRSIERSKNSSMVQFIESLGLQVSYRRAAASCEADVGRASQLTLRTNQFNTTTIRRTPDEISQYLSSLGSEDGEDRRCTLVEAADRFGDYGVVGLLIYSCGQQALTVSSFMLSCRVLGRGVEHQVVGYLGREASEAGCSEVVFEVLKSEKNAPVMKFFDTLCRYFDTELVVTPEIMNLRLPSEGCKHVSYAAICEGNKTRNEVEYELPSPVALTSHSLSRLNSIRSVPLQRRPAIDILSSVQSMESMDFLSPHSSPNSSPRACTSPKAKRREMMNLLIQASRDNQSEKTISELQQSLIELFAKVLRLNDQHPDIDDNFFDLGGTSVHAVRLISALDQKLSVKLPLTQIGETPTVRSLSEAIESYRLGKEVEAVKYDVEDDVILDESITAEGLSYLPQRVTAPSSILLTGATGFLGAFLARKLLQETGATIICLVRAADSRQGMQRLQKNFEQYNLWQDDMNQRIRPLVGDLAKLRFGLSISKWDELSTQVDSIYHNGALLNFTFTYDRFKDANIRGTEEVLRLATQTFLKPVHYVSTVAIFGSSEVMGCEFIDETQQMPSGNSVFGGYAQSKWVAEKLVRIGHERGIPITVHRPGAITGDSQTGAWNVDDATARMVRSIMMLGMAPKLDTNVEWLPVDYVAEWIVDLSLNEANIGRTFHQVEGSVRPYNTMIASLKRYHPNLLVTSYSQWREAMQIAAESEDHPLHTLIPFFFNSAAGGKTLLETRLPEFRSSITQSCLKKRNAIPSQEQLVRTYLLSLVENNALDSRLVVDGTTPRPSCY
eukprot:TRINITY_DN1711_c0_g1_i1.p1 TRINITY_DN1711_c0_g1~~TRINITY_DN1711_c0_g1_i1.p1  ORF type:complete len:3706 (+),score=768.40 TRINITY_DN1711_c0_g1_i1:419-11119(+)